MPSTIATFFGKRRQDYEEWLLLNFDRWFSRSSLRILGYPRLNLNRVALHYDCLLIFWPFRQYSVFEFERKISLNFEDQVH